MNKNIYIYIYIRSSCSSALQAAWEGKLKTDDADDTFDDGNNYKL